MGIVDWKRGYSVVSTIGNQTLVNEKEVKSLILFKVSMKEQM